MLVENRTPELPIYIGFRRLVRVSSRTGTIFIDFGRTATKNSHSYILGQRVRVLFELQLIVGLDRIPTHCKGILKLISPQKQNVVGQNINMQIVLFGIIVVKSGYK